jgi:hypothetical protein
MPALHSDATATQLASKVPHSQSVAHYLVKAVPNARQGNRVNEFVTRS